MANQNFNQWLKFNKRPDESLREAIHRFSDLTEDPDGASEYLTDEYTEEILQDETQKSLIDTSSTPQLAEGESPHAGFGETIKKSGLRLLESGAGLAATTLPEGYGREYFTDVLQDLEDVSRTEKPAATYQDYIEEGQAPDAGFFDRMVGTLYENLPESTPTAGQMGEGVIESFFPTVTGIAGATLGFFTQGPTGMVVGGTLGATAGSTGVVTGSTYPRVLEDPMIREALGVPVGPDYSELEPEDQVKMRDIASEIAGDVGLTRSYTSGVLEMPSNLFLPWIKGWGAVKQVAARYGMDVLGGTAAEVMDEQVYAYEVKQNLIDAGLSEAQAEAYRQKIREMGPTNFETAWGAFVNEVVLGGAPAAAETAAAYAFKKDHRVNTPATVNNELLEPISEEAIKDAEKEAVQVEKDEIDLQQKRANLTVTLEKIRLQREEARRKQEQAEYDDLVKHEKEYKKASDEAIKEAEGLIASGQYTEEEIDFVEDRITGLPSVVIKIPPVVTDIDTLADKTTTELKEEADALALDPTRPAEDNVIINRNRREIDRRGRRKNFLRSAEDLIDGVSYSQASNPVVDELTADQEVDEALTEDEIIDAELEHLTNLRDEKQGLNYKVGVAALKTFSKFLSGLGVKITPMSWQERYERMLAGEYGEQFTRSDDPKEEKLREIERLKGLLGGEGYVRGVDELVIVPESMMGDDSSAKIKRMAKVVFHEVFGHLGLRLKKGGKTGDAYTKDYKDMIYGFGKTAKKEIMKFLEGPLGSAYKGKKYGWETVKEGDPSFLQMEEYIARNYAEFGIQRQWAIDKLVSALRKRLKGLPGFNSVTEGDLINVLNELQDEYIPNNRSIISGEKFKLPKAQVQPEEKEETTPADEPEVSESRRDSDFDRFVSYGGRTPLRQYDKPRFDTAKAPKKTARDAERYVDASLLDAMKKKVWPEQLVRDLSNFDRFPEEFQKSFRKSLKSGLMKPEQKLANAILSKGREAFLQKKKGNVTPDTSAPKGFEAQGAEWKALVDDVPKWARTTAEVQRALRQSEAKKGDEISESRAWRDDPATEELQYSFPFSGRPKGRSLFIQEPIPAEDIIDSVDIVEAFDYPGNTDFTRKEWLENASKELNKPKGNYVFHVTSTKNVAKIKKEGLKLLQPSNWVRGRGGERFQKEPGLFALTNAEDALNWGSKHDVDTGERASILRIREDSEPISESRRVSAQPVDEQLLPSGDPMPSWDWSLFQQRIPNPEEYTENSLLQDAVAKAFGTGVRRGQTSKLLPEKKKPKGRPKGSIKKEPKRIKVSVKDYEQFVKRHKAWQKVMLPALEKLKRSHSPDRMKVDEKVAQEYEDLISESRSFIEDKYGVDLPPRKIMVLPPKALPATEEREEGKVFQQWVDRGMISEDAPSYRAGGRYIDVSDGMPASASQPDMTGTTVPYAEIDTNFPGNRASFNVSGVDSQRTIKDNKRTGKPRITGSRISTGAVISSNLIGQGQAKFLDADPGVRTDTKNIATLQNEGIRKFNEQNGLQETPKGNYSDHLFASQVVYDTDVELSTTGKDESPSLRPKAYGDIIVGDQIATVLIGGRQAPLYDRLIVVPPNKNDVSYSYVGEVGLREYVKRNGTDPRAAQLASDLARQKKGSKKGPWFNPGVRDDKFRTEVPNTGVKIKEWWRRGWQMPFTYTGWRGDYDVNVDFKLETRKQSVGEKNLETGKVRIRKLKEALPWMRLGDFLDLGVLSDYYPQLDTTVIHFDKEEGYGTAYTNHYDNVDSTPGQSSITIGIAPPDKQTLVNLDPSNMDMSTEAWVEDIHMKEMNTPDHDGVPHRLISAILHELQHVIQQIEGFETGGSTEEMVHRVTEDRITKIIRGSTTGIWASIGPNSRLKIQKRFGKLLKDRHGEKEAKKMINKFGLKTPYTGSKWSKGHLFLSDDPIETLKRWGKSTKLEMMDVFFDADEARARKLKNLFDEPVKALLEATMQLAKDKQIKAKDALKIKRLLANMMEPFTMNALGTRAGPNPIYIQGQPHLTDDRFKASLGQSDYLKLIGEVEARDVQNRYIDMFRGNGRSGLPILLDKMKRKTQEYIVKEPPFLAGGTERGVTRILRGGTGAMPINVPGEKPVGAPWDVNDMVSYSMNDALGDFANRLDIVTRARIAQIENLTKDSPERREAIRQLHMEMILNPIPIKDPTKPLPYQDEVSESSVAYEDLSWSQRLPGHELSGTQLAENYLKDPKKWENIRTTKGDYEKSGAGGRGEGPIIIGLGLKNKAILTKKKDESDEVYQNRIQKQADADYGELNKRAARLLYLGKIWTNWQMIRDMFGLNPGGRGRDAVPYLGHIISFMKLQREKLMTGKMTARDIAKSVVMTLASQGADANNPWTVYNLTGGVKKAKAYKKNKYPASLQTFAEYMNAADWTDGEANIGQKELNGELTEDLIVDYYNRAPLWVVNVPWNGEGPNGDMQYQQISDGVLYPKTVSWEEASRTPKYGTNGEKKTELQYTGGKPQLVKVSGQWMLRIDKSDYTGMQHYLRAKRNEAFIKNIEEVKRPEINKKIEKYQKIIAELKANKTLDKETKNKKIKRNQDLLDKNNKALVDLEKKINKDNQETTKVSKRLFSEMPLWFKDPGKEKAPSEKTGAVWVPQEYATTGGKPRMEDAVAYYFSTDDGQALLDGIEQGNFDLKGWRKLANVRLAFGDDRLNQLLKESQKESDGNFKKAGLRDLTEYTKQFNDIVKKWVGDKDPETLQGDDDASVKLRLDLAGELGDFAQKLYGIAEAKQAFFKHFLGLGDAPTIDAIELNTHIAGSPATDLVTSPLTGKPVANTWRVDLKWWSLKLQDSKISGMPGVGAKGMGDSRTFFEHYRDTIKKAFDDIKRDVDQRDPSIFADVPADYFYHVMHHWLWDVGKALTRADAVMGQSTERYRPAAYEAMWRDDNQQVLGYFKNDPIEATMVDWEPGHNHTDAIAEVAEGDIGFLEEISESVSLASMKGKLVQRSMADRFATGFYVAQDQTSNIWPDTYQGKKGYWMRGGMGYPLLEDNKKARAAWAADDIKIVRNVRDLQKMGADHVITVVGAPDMHFSNKAYFSIFWRETQDLINKDPKKKQALIDRIDSIILNPTNKNLLPVVEALKGIQGKDSWERLKLVAPTLSFGDRKPIVVALGGAFGIKNPATPIVSYPNNALWEDTTVFKEVAVGTPVGIIKLDPIGTQKMDQRAKDLGIPPHEAYEFAFKGEVIGSWIGQKPGVPFDNKQFRKLFKDYEKKIVKKFKYKPGTFDISVGSKYMFSKAKIPFKIPGAEIIKLEKIMDAPTTPVSFSQAVQNTANNPTVIQDLETAQQKQAEWAVSHSLWDDGKPKLFSKPLDQNVELPFGRKLSDFVTRIMEPFGKVDEPGLLRTIRRVARGKILRIEEVSSKVYKALKNTKHSKAIYEYLTQKGGDLSKLESLGVPLKERMYAKEAKLTIVEIGKMLVRAGLLHESALERYKDSYLPKVYLQYLLDENDIYAIQRGLSNKVSNMDYLKRRKDVPEYAEKLLKGLVKDPAFLAGKMLIQPARDVALLDMFEEIVVTSKERGLNWVLPASLIEFDFLGEIRKAAKGKAIGATLEKELARLPKERETIENEIKDLDQAIRDERKVLRAKDRIQSKELSGFIKERKALQDRLKMLKPRSMSGWALKKEADRLTKSIWPNLKEDHPNEAEVVLDLAEEMHKQADGVINRAEAIIPKDYEKIPNNARYGKLRGLVVQKEIYDDLVGATKMTKPTNAAEAIIGEGGLLGKAGRTFKFSKVAANFPAAWIRNFTSNTIAMNLGGMPMGKIPYFLTKASRSMIDTWIEDFRENSAKAKGQPYTRKRTVYDEVKDLGLTSSTFATVELGVIEKDYENFLNRTQRKGSPFRAFFKVKEFLNMAKDWTSDKYGMIDSLGKTMMYMNGIDQGMSPAQAADEAEKWLFDYSLVKPSVKTLRKDVLGAPFITYASKVLPLMVETISTRPWRLAPYVALPYAMAALFKSEHDLDDDEYDAMIESLQEYLREKKYAGNIMPLIYLDEHGRPQILDLAYLYPWGMFSEMASELMSDDPLAVIQTIGLMTGVGPTVIAGITTGVDPFTRRPIVNKLDDKTEQMKQILQYTWNLMMPPWIHTEYGAVSRLKQTLEGELNRYGEPQKTVPQAISQGLGFNVTPVEPHGQRTKNLRWMQSEVIKTQSYAKRTLRDMKAKGSTKEELKEKKEYFLKVIKEKYDNLMDYKKRSKFPKSKFPPLKKAG